MTRDIQGNDWIQTIKGRAFWIFDPKPEDFDIEEIANALAMQCRFNGHVRQFYSVAEHSVRVAWLLRDWGEPAEIVFAGLMHDAAEAYIGDVVRPLKRVLESYQDIEFAVEQALAIRYHLPFPMPATVKRADTVLLHVERRALLAEPPRPWNEPDLPLPRTQICGEMHWGLARHRFLELFNELACSRGKPRR